MFNYALTRENGGGYTLCVYLDGYDAEFGRDFIDNIKNYPAGLSEKIFLFLRENAGSLKIRSVRFVLGGTILLAITLLPASRGDDSGSPRYSFSYIYFGTAAEQNARLSIAAASLDTVSPSYFDINGSGSLVLNSISGDFVRSRHQEGLNVVPFLSNHWNRAAGVAALENSDRLTSDIAAAVEQYDLDGVNVDIENLTGESAAKYVAFMRLLRSKIPSHKEVSVAVAANPRGSVSGWQGSYDYTGLAQAADHLVIMAYDEHYSGGIPGPVSSAAFFENSIKYALSKVPAEKIVVAIPFYGRIWGGSLSGYGLSLTRVGQLKDAYNGQVYYDFASKTPVLKFTVKNSDARLTVGGKALAAGNYTVYYENGASLREKLGLIQKYNLKGAASWSLLMETPDVWDYYSLWLNGRYFSDTSAHFAADSIQRMAARGIILGMTEDAFMPDEGMTRAQAAAIIVRTLGLMTEDSGPAFFDTAGHWASDEISAAVSAGILKGYPDGTFRPDSLLTREEFSAVIARACGISPYTGNDESFADVKFARWSYAEIEALYRSGIIKGYGSGIFAPEKPLSRGEAAALIDRLDI